MDFKATIKGYQQRIEAALHEFTPAPGTRPAVLHEAMRYSLDAGGKRLRPCLLLAAFDLYPSKPNPMPAAVAIECMHTYSLIHDDLPCMDNSDLRRGKPSCHKQFDEETALLAGDALLTHSLFMLADNYRSTPEIATALVRELGDAGGSEHLIGGQMEDLLGERGTPTPEQLDFIHHNKTAALITCSLVMGLILTSPNQENIALMRKAGRHLGLAFQIVDDILDVVSDAETMGKPVGADLHNEKMTYPSLYGLEESRMRVREHTQISVDCFEKIGGNNSLLIDLARYMENRAN